MTGKSKLEHLLDRVKYAEHEVTIDVSTFTPAQVAQVIAAAEKRRFNVAGDNRHLLIRDLREGAV